MRALGLRIAGVMLVGTLLSTGFAIAPAHAQTAQVWSCTGGHTWEISPSIIEAGGLDLFESWSRSCLFVNADPLHPDPFSKVTASLGPDSSSTPGGGFGNCLFGFFNFVGGLRVMIGPVIVGAGVVTSAAGVMVPTGAPCLSPGGVTYVGVENFNGVFL